MILTNPFTGKQVDASDEEVANQLLGAGFKKQEPASQAAKKPAAGTRSRKSK